MQNQRALGVYDQVIHAKVQARARTGNQWGWYCSVYFFQPITTSIFFVVSDNTTIYSCVALQICSKAMQPSAEQA